MKKFTSLLIPVAIGIGIAGAAIAQQPPAPGAQPTPPKRERPSPEFMQRMQDGRIAMITGALKLTEAQQKLWAPVEAKMRENQAERMKRMQSMMEQRQQNQAGGQRGDMMQRMERMQTMMAERMERQKAFLTVFKPFYESLSDEQKQVAGPLMAQAMGGGKGGMRGHRGGGMRYGMMHGGGMHRGPMPQ